MLSTTLVLRTSRKLDSLVLVYVLPKSLIPSLRSASFLMSLPRSNVRKLKKNRGVSLYYSQLKIHKNESSYFRHRNRWFATIIQSNRRRRLHNDPINAHGASRAVCVWRLWIVLDSLF